MTKGTKALITFIKNPEKGKVKTRLAATVGDDQALKIYKELMRHTREISLAVSAERLLFYSQQINTKDDWSSESFSKHLQHTGDLGERIIAAFQEGFKVGEKVIIVGSDCPKLSAEIIEEGFRKLDTHDFVLGPAFDGGYYLLGMKKLELSLFQDMPWSTETVAQITRERIASTGQSLAELETLSDVDYEEDWVKYGWEV